MTPPPLAGDLWLLLAVCAVALPIGLGRLPLLCAGVFVAVGAAGTLQLADHGWPLLIAVPVLVAGCALLGWLIALVTRRGIAVLAVATWGLGWFVQQLWVDVPSLAGGADGAVGPVPPRLSLPAWAVSIRLTPLEIGLAALPFVLVALPALQLLADDPIGLRLRFARDAPELVDSLDAATRGRRVRDRRAVFALTGALAGLAGAGLGLAAGAVSPGDAGPLLSVQLVLAALVTGTARWWSPLAGTAVLLGLDEVAAHLAGGVDLGTRSALVTAAAFALVIGIRHLPQHQPTASLSVAGSGLRTRQRPPRVREPVLRAADLVVRYDAVVALDGVSVEIRAGGILGVVGANGSGKSTLLSVLAGARLPDSGVVELRDARVARTLQAGHLVDRLTVADHVRLGAAASATASWWPARRLASTPLARRVLQQHELATEHALQLAGLLPVAGRRIGQLDAGVRPFVAIAAALATGAGVLLLDEPAAGLDRAARSRLADLVVDLAARGTALVVVDHDLDLVASVADEVVALAAGRIVRRGNPDDIDLLAATAAAAP